MSEEVEGDFTAKTCSEVLDPVPASLESDCTSGGREGQTLTYLPDGCPESDDLIGSCLTVSTFETAELVTATYHYASGNDAVDQQIRALCVSADTDPGTGASPVSLDRTWCAGSLE